MTHIAEVLQGELVHGVYLSQRGYDEVEDGAPGGHSPVLFPGSVDLCLGHLCLLQSVRDRVRRHLL